MTCDYYEQILEALSLSDDASFGYDQYPKEDISTITYYHPDGRIETVEMETQNPYIEE